MMEIETPPNVIDLEKFLENALSSFESGVSIDEKLFSVEKVRLTLEYFGASFDKEREGFEKLRSATNKGRRLGMDAVWGKDVMDNYNVFTTLWAEGYEEALGKKLPKLQTSGKKTSGMRHLLGELTAYAAGFIEPEDIVNRLKIRFSNGKAYAENRPQDREKMDLITAGVNEKILGSIPPTYSEGLVIWLKGAKPQE